MQIEKLSYTQIPQISATDLAYQTEDPRLNPFFRYKADITQFEEIIKYRHFRKEKREVLAKVLNRQYEGISVDKTVADKLHKIGLSNSYTITTAHQPSLLTGPLYFIYKIAGTIHLCRRLEKEYPEYNFIPVYWMGGEDHDFEEVNHLSLFNKAFSWEDAQGGSVSNYRIASLLPLLEEIYIMLGETTEAKSLKTILQAAFQPQFSYGQAMFRFINALFGAYGLLVLIPDSPELKRMMIPVFENDLTLHDSKRILEETIEKLKTAGFKNQAHVREINLFYLQPNRRDRIVLTEEGSYEVLHTEIRFSQQEILSELHEYPERFSPNVILRPLFQETVLPNLAYIGGGGEIAYWLERRAQFEHFGVPFPMLIRRNSLQYIDSTSFQKMEKLQIAPAAIFSAEADLIKAYVETNAEAELNFGEEMRALELIFQKIIDKTVLTDPTLEASVSAQQAQLFNALDKLQTRLLRAEKKKQETAVQQIKKLKEKLFPGGGLQERSDNFMALYIQYGSSLIDFLATQLNPLEKNFLVMIAD